MRIGTLKIWKGEAKTSGSPMTKKKSFQHNLHLCPLIPWLLCLNLFPSLSFNIFPLGYKFSFLQLCTLSMTSDLVSLLVSQILAFLILWSILVSRYPVNHNCPSAPLLWDLNPLPLQLFSIISVQPPSAHGQQESLFLLKSINICYSLKKT